MPTLQHTLYFAPGFTRTFEQRQQWGVGESPSNNYLGSTFDEIRFWGLYGNSKYANSASRIWGYGVSQPSFNADGVAIFNQEHMESLSSTQRKYVAMTQPLDWPGIEGQDFASSAQLVYEGQFNKILLPEPRSLRILSLPVYRGFDERMAGHCWSMEVEVTTTDWLPFCYGFNPLNPDADVVTNLYYTSPGDIYNVIVNMFGSRPHPSGTGRQDIAVYFVGGIDYPFGDFDYVRLIPGTTSYQPASYDSPLVDISVQSVKRVYNGFEITARVNTVTGPLAGGVAFVGWQVFADTGSSVPNKEGVYEGAYLQHPNNVGSTGRSWRDKGYWQGGTYIATGEEVVFIIPHDGRYRIRAVAIDNRGYVGSYQLPANFDPNSTGWPNSSSSRAASERPLVLYENPVPTHYDKNSSSLEIIWKDKTISPNPVYTAKAKTLTSPFGGVRPLAWYGNPNSTLLNDQPIDFLHGKDYRIYLPRYGLDTGVGIPGTNNVVFRQVGEGSDTGPYAGRTVIDNYSSEGIQGAEQALGKSGAQNTTDAGRMGIAFDISPDDSILYVLRHIYTLPPLTSADILDNQRQDYIAFTKLFRNRSQRTCYREWENLPSPFESSWVAGHLVTGLDGLRPPCKMFNFPWGFFLFGQHNDGVMFAQANNEGKDWEAYALQLKHLLIGATRSDDSSYLFAVTVDPEGVPFVTRAKLVRTEWVFDEKEPCEGLPETISYPGSMVYAAGYLRLVFYAEDTLRHAYSADNGRSWTVTE